MIEIALARGDDPALKALLDGAGLPTDDLEDAGRVFFLATSDRLVCGCGGFELAGGDVLLRSVAVDPDHRGHGLGKAITLHVLDCACQGGTDRAYLLTTSTALFFEGLGFVRIDRAAAPDAILRTRQASSICPASAVLMVKDLGS